MSTFSGIIKEIPFISVDRFDNDNLNSKLFFLSHCHTDHMVGLSNNDLPGPLYVSPISAVILQGKYNNLKNIHCLQIGGNNFIIIIIVIYLFVYTFIVYIYYIYMFLFLQFQRQYTYQIVII